MRPKQVLRDSTSVRPRICGPAAADERRVADLDDSPRQTTLTLATSLAEAQAMQLLESADPIQAASATYVARPSTAAARGGRAVRAAPELRFRLRPRRCRNLCTRTRPFLLCVP